MFKQSTYGSVKQGIHSFTKSILSHSDGNQHTQSGLRKNKANDREGIPLWDNRISV